MKQNEKMMKDGLLNLGVYEPKTLEECQQLFLEAKPVSEEVRLEVLQYMRTKALNTAYSLITEDGKHFRRDESMAWWDFKESLGLNMNGPAWDGEIIIPE